MLSKKGWFWTFASLALIFAVWEMGSHLWFNPLFVPPPSSVLRVLWTMIWSGDLAPHVVASLRRILVGWILGIVTGFFFGLGMYTSSGFAIVLRGPFELIRSIPPVALVPLAMLWFGIGEFSKYMITMFTTFLVVAQATENGLQTVPTARLRAAACLGIPKQRMLRTVVLPSALVHVLNAITVSVGFAFMGVVAAELIAARTGLGYLITQSRIFLQTNHTFVGLLSLGLLAMLTDALVRWSIQRWFGRFMYGR